MFTLSQINKYIHPVSHLVIEYIGVSDDPKKQCMYGYTEKCYNIIKQNKINGFIGAIMGDNVHIMELMAKKNDHSFYNYNMVMVSCVYGSVEAFKYLHERYTFNIVDVLIYALCSPNLKIINYLLTLVPKNYYIDNLFNNSIKCRCYDKIHFILNYDNWFDKYNSINKAVNYSYNNLKMLKILLSHPSSNPHKYHIDLLIYTLKSKENNGVTDTVNLFCL
jgi:hypothetical protein